MRIDWKSVRIFIKPGITDMRKQTNSLAEVTENQMHQDPMNGNLYLFCSRNRRILKVLYWDRNGFCLWYKKLEKGKFPWAVTEEEVREISEEELIMLLSGIDFFNAHQKLYFSYSS